MKLWRVRMRPGQPLAFVVLAGRPVFGVPGNAVSSMVSEMAKGKTIEEAMKITNAEVAKELGGLPPNKLHCSNLGADALHRAIENYLVRKPEPGKKGCRCPFCDAPVEGSNICTPCKTQGRK